MKNINQSHEKPIVCLDPGHYGKYNPGVVGGYYESEMNWKLHLLLKSELEARGITVKTTRSDPEKDLDLVSRGKVSSGCDLFLSIHSNATGSGINEKVDYPVVYVQLDGRGDALGKLLANTITAVMGTRQAGYIKTRKGNHGEYYGVLRGAAAVGTVGMILEHSFHTNTKMCAWLMEEENLRKLAKEEAKVIAEYFGMEKQPGITLTLPVLKKGAKGAQVKALQALLLGYGYEMKSAGGTVYGADGSFGGATDRAVREYQKDNGLAVDGSVGSATWNRLLGIG